MHVDFYGLRLDAPKVTFYLWSPWRASALEHKLFDVVVQLPNVHIEKDADEIRAHVADSKVFQTAMTGVRRTLKGWQEEAEAGRERRGWRWMLEGDTDDHGYDHAGEPHSLWAFLRLSMERGSLEDGEKGEDVDMNGFGLRVWPKGTAPA
ncbi:MAG: hypothetical protein K2X38_19900 [Gemmataceae bacterium]|nr:hypothetical protein [Gemmataceae bacterium]